MLIISQIPNGNASELIFNTVHVKDAGFYVCRVNNNCTFEFSQWSQLDVCDVTELTESLQGKEVECWEGNYLISIYFNCLLLNKFKVSKYYRKLTYLLDPI